MPRTLSIAFLIALLSGICAGEEQRVFTEKDRSWWAIQPITDPPAPGNEKNPIDAFVARKRAEKKLTAAPAAGPNEFIRRAYFDLHGLPPTPDQIDEFVAAWENSPDTAIAALTDELLASPRYGERWAQHWLDIVRYAESDGYREDAFRPGAHRYRDYVIRAFNSDKPYDQFVREQLAADEIAPDDPEILEATGFLRLGVYEWNQRDAEGQREIMLNEITDLTGEVFLGVGIGCARCHDHKFDPILQRDYFALQAFLSATTWPDDHKLGTPDQLKQYETWQQKTATFRTELDLLLFSARREARNKHVQTFPPEVQEMYWKPSATRSSYEHQIALLVQRQVDREEAKVDPGKALAKDKIKLARYQELSAQLAEQETQQAKRPNAFISTDTGAQPAKTHMGQGEERTAVEPAYLTLLEAESPQITPTANTTGRRRALADWIASKRNPLAARVIVNRIWQYHFGTGLAASPNDFGTLGAPPSHPELLDWLTTRFIEGGWKIKPLHRLMMSSRTYRMTARHEPGQHESITDPDNRLLWRFPPQRLSAEQVRDAMLTISGEIQHRDHGGPSASGDSPVRSLYVKKERNTPEPFLHSFDAPTGFDSAPERQTTTTPTQALLLTNNDWPMARARAFAKRLLGKESQVGAAEIARAYQLAWGREASRDEIASAVVFIQEQAAELREKSPPLAPAVKFPNETGLRPIAQNFSTISDPRGRLGEKALWLQPGSRFEQLHLEGAAPEGETFTIEAIAQLDAIYKDASVNTLISRWDGDHNSPGWALGVTSAKSRYKPRNLIVQLIGHNPGGDTEYEVVASDLHVPLGKPFQLAVTIAPKKITFTLDGQTAEVEHHLIDTFQNPTTRLIIGGRDQKKIGHLWDGQLARLQSPGKTLTFQQNKLPPDTTWLKKSHPQPKQTDPSQEALADFCHALLSSNEFLYLH